MRIISTVPSQTELLYDLGLDSEVIGITKFCEHPHHWRSEKTIIGGTKNLHIEQIINLRPDWIFSNKEENIKEQIESLHPYCQHFTSDVYDLTTALSMIEEIGLITAQSIRSKALIDSINNNFNALPAMTKARTCIYLIWKGPYMSVGQDTFIHDMLSRCGWHNLLSDKYRYPSLSVEEIIQLNPDDILLSSEPFPFNQSHIEELKQWLPNKNFILVDGSYFSWYGSRLAKSPEYFNTIIRNLY